MKSKRALSEKEMVLSLKFEISNGRQLDVQFLDLTCEELQIFMDLALQEIIAAIIQRLNEAKELSERFRPITSLELLVTDGDKFLKLKLKRPTVGLRLLYL